MTVRTPALEKRTIPWSRTQWGGYLSVAAAGIAAGAVATYARMPLLLPGHKAILWIPLVVAARIVTRRRAGASVGALAAVLTTFWLGGKWAGGLATMPLVVAAGVVLDGVIAMAPERAVVGRRFLLWLGAGGSVANLILFAKRLLETGGLRLPGETMHDLAWAVGFHAAFGFGAGWIGGWIAQRFIRRAQRRALQAR